MIIKLINFFKLDFMNNIRKLTLIYDRWWGNLIIPLTWWPYPSTYIISKKKKIQYFWLQQNCYSIYIRLYVYIICIYPIHTYCHMYTCMYLLGFCPNEHYASSLILSIMVSNARRHHRIPTGLQSKLSSPYSLLMREALLSPLYVSSSPDLISSLVPDCGLFFIVDKLTDSSLLV